MISNFNFYWKANRNDQTKTYIEFHGVNGMEWWKVNDRQGAKILKALKESQIWFKEGVKAGNVAFNPNTLESEPGRSLWVKGHRGLHSEIQDCLKTLSQNNKHKRNPLKIKNFKRILNYAVVVKIILRNIIVVSLELLGAGNIHSIPNAVIFWVN